MHLILHLTRTLKAREDKLRECASFNSAFFVRTPPAKNRLHLEEASSSRACPGPRSHGPGSHSLVPYCPRPIQRDLDSSWL